MSETEPPPLESRVSFLLSQLGAQSANEFAAGLASLGLNPNQFGLLVHVARAEGQTQQRLAEILGIHRNTMVSVTDDLESRGLVERRRHPLDRRAHAIYLTEKARALLPQAGQVADDLESRFLHGISADDRRALAELLARLSSNVVRNRGVHPGFGG